MHIQPYLFFDGRCEEAIDFYKQAVGAKVEMLMRFKESPEPHRPGALPPGSENKVMHASLKIGETNVMVSDGECTGSAKFSGVNLSISVATDAEADRIYNALKEGGKVTIPIGKTFFSSRFGMVHDRFGVSWMVIVAQQ